MQKTLGRTAARGTGPAVTAAVASPPPAPALHVPLRLDGVTVRYGATTALDRVTLAVGDASITCLLGPSGSGKSTLLRVIAGLEPPTSGRVILDGIEVAGPRVFLDPERRRVGMVFQDYALFPHLTIAANVAFGLRGRPRAAVDEIVGRLLERLDLARYARSYPHMLSGGERQRAALARALAPAPRVLLMDEPFSSLDDRLRDRVREETLQVLRETQTTTIVVTHDPDEAMRIADEIVLLDGGQVVQAGAPDDLYTRPATLFAARFFSEVNELPCTCAARTVETPLGVFPAPDLTAGDDAVVCVRPEHVRVVDGPTPLRGHVVRSAFLGASHRLVVAIAGLDEPLTAVVRGRRRFDPGDPVFLQIDPDEAIVVSRTRPPSSFNGALAC